MQPLIFLCLFICSTVRRPIRGKSRLSLVSAQSVSTVSSEDGRVLEYPGGNSQISTLGYNQQQDINSNLERHDEVQSTSAQEKLANSISEQDENCNRPLDS